MNHNYAEYLTYAHYFAETTGCDPMSYADWAKA